MGTTATDKQVEQYGDVCDVICRELFGEHFKIDPNDGLKHTSSESRRIASLIFDVLDLW